MCCMGNLECLSLQAQPPVGGGADGGGGDGHGLGARPHPHDLPQRGGHSPTVQPLLRLQEHRDETTMQEQTHPTRLFAFVQW